MPPRETLDQRERDLLVVRQGAECSKHELRLPRLERFRLRRESGVPAYGGAAVSGRIFPRDQSREREGIREREAPKLSRGELRVEQVPTLDRALEAPVRCPLRRRGGRRRDDGSKRSLGIRVHAVSFGDRGRARRASFGEGARR